MENKHEHRHHVTPFRIYYLVWGGLLVMTVVTVLSSYVDFGYANMLIALAIATFKALLVILFFMGLKYEGQENNVTFFMSFVFLAIFISLTISDVLYRTPVDSLKVDASGVVQTSAPVEVAKFMQPTPQLLARGKELYGQQCMTCHGATGKGDGPAAAALNPKPRDFIAAEGWKFGRNLTGLFKTITNGSPGTAMPPFPGLNPDERFAIAHYLHTIMPNPPKDSPADVQALQASLGSGTAKPRISIAKAMEKLAEPELRRASMHGRAEGRGRGAEIYKQYCMTCHGVAGEGEAAVLSIGVNPPLRQPTPPLGSTVESQPEFVRVVSQGFPGRGMPSFAQFTSGEWRELYEYVRALARK